MTSAENDSLAAVVVAAGSGRRFGGDKLFVSLGGRPVLAWSLLALECTAEVSEIVLVLAQDNLDAGLRLVRRLGLSKVIAIRSGGARRQDSVQNGLKAVEGSNWVAIHDGARPFVDAAMIRRGFSAARAVGAAIAAVPVKDTVKVVDSSRLIHHTPSRASLWAAQTPQIFQVAQLRSAYAALDGVDVTDDAELLERSGRPVAVFDGAYSNLKITTPEDLAVARAIARTTPIARLKSLTCR